MFYKKEEREVIEKLNSVLSIKHRSKPYDVNAIGDVKELFKMTVAEHILFIH